MTKPREKTREELTAEIEDGKKKIRQFENREKMLRQKLSKEERRTRSHRLIVRGLINAEKLDMMKPSALLVNVARGPVVNEADLAAALEKGVIAGACLDVFEKEPPLDPESPILRAPNTLATPHVAFATRESMSLGVEIIRIRVLTGPFIGLFYIGSNFLQASGNAPLSMLVSMLRQGIFLIPMLYVMNYFFEVKGNVCAHVAADLLAVAAAVILAVRQYKKLQTTLQVNETTGGQTV